MNPFHSLPRTKLHNKPGTGTKLELGCGAHPTLGYMHHDRWQHSDHVDVAHDLDVLPWPWDDNSFDEILALDVFEHLRVDIQQWLDECWRILKPGGYLVFRTPAWDHWTAWVDPTHRRAFHLQTFDYWDPSKFFWQEYGRFYFGPDYNKWWRVDRAAKPGDGNLYFTLIRM